MKTYKINGKEIEELGYLIDGSENIVDKFNSLLEALSDKEEECNCCGWDDNRYTHEPGCSLREETKEERYECYCGGDCKHDWVEPKEEVNPSKSTSYKEEPKQEKDTNSQVCKHSEKDVNKQEECGRDGKTMWCYCGKCKQEDYPLPKDFPKQSTNLKEGIKLLCYDFSDINALIVKNYNTENSNQEENLQKRKDKIADKILSLIQSHIVKEIPPPRYTREIESTGYNQCREDIIKIINNLN